MKMEQKNQNYLTRMVNIMENVLGGGQLPIGNFKPIYEWVKTWFL